MQREYIKIHIALVKRTKLYEMVLLSPKNGCAIYKCYNTGKHRTMR